MGTGAEARSLAWPMRLPSSSTHSFNCWWEPWATVLLGVGVGAKFYLVGKLGV